MKTDKPIAAKIILTLINPQDSGENFIGLSSSLYQNGLIFSEPRELRRTKENLELSVIFRDRDSFANWISHTKVKEYWSEKFKDQLSSLPQTIEEIDVIIEASESENCACSKPDFYILQGRAFGFTDELTCGTCLNQVPYSKVPQEINIEQWQRYNERFYLNWLESGIFEQDALKELTNYKKGKLNLQGEEIRTELSSHFKIPVYLNYFLEEPDDNTTCPLCREQGTDSNLSSPGKICTNCNTIFG